MLVGPLQDAQATEDSSAARLARWRCSKLNPHCKSVNTKGGRDQQRRVYPRRAEIQRAVSAARDMGIAVTGYELKPDGTIRITSGRSDPDTSASEFERWDAAGRL